MMRQKRTTHNLTCDLISEASLHVTRAGDIEKKSNFMKFTSGASTPASLFHVAARVAKHFIPALLIALMLLGAPTPTQARVNVGISVVVAPPPLLVYEQPLCPGPGFIWAPGYWAWGPDGYFWVPGTWVLAPFPGELWTPGYWAWEDDAYIWNEGYWGPEVGFYGGVVYGFGYVGFGYQGGYWQNGAFFYNRAVNNVSTTDITNVYNRNVVNNTTMANVSYNGGPGGTTARPTATQLAAAQQRHDPPAPAQRQQLMAARANRAQYASASGGRPIVAATAKPGAFSGPGAVRASRAGSSVNNIATNRAAENHAAPRNSRSGSAATRPLLNGHPQAGSSTQPAGRPLQPRAKTRAISPQSNMSHTALPRSAPNRHTAPAHPATQRKALPHSEGPPHTSAMHRSAPYTRRTARGPAPQRTAVPEQSAPRATAQYRMPMRPGTPRAIAHPRNMPRSQPLPRAVVQQRNMPRPPAAPRPMAPRRPSAPQPRRAQQRFPHGHSGGR